jgi:hypothetical protein
VGRDGQPQLGDQFPLGRNRDRIVREVPLAGLALVVFRDLRGLPEFIELGSNERIELV